MVVKKPIPIWSVALTIVVVIGLAAAFLLSVNPSLDKDALVRARFKPGTAPTAASSSTYGMPKGTPIVHNDPNQMADSRRKPGG